MNVKSGFVGGHRSVVNINISILVSRDHAAVA